MSYQTVDSQYVLDHIGKMPIVDVRPASMYAQGHIPTAISDPFDEAESKGDLGENLAAVLEEQGIGPNDDIITSCQTGRHAKMASDALEGVGFTNIHYYKGSYTDWASDSSRPIEK